MLAPLIMLVGEHDEHSRQKTVFAISPEWRGDGLPESPSTPRVILATADFDGGGWEGECIDGGLFLEGPWPGNKALPLCPLMPCSSCGKTSARPWSESRCPEE